MILEEIDVMFSGELGLVFDMNERGAARTYFLEKVYWEPIRNTRIARVAYDSSGKVTSIRLCVSSDNNNSVFVTLPITGQELKKIIADEITTWLRNNAVSEQVTTPFNSSLNLDLQPRTAALRHGL